MKTKSSMKQTKDGLRRIKRGIFLNTKTGNYLYRFEHQGRDYEKVIGPQREAAEMALSEALQEVRISKMAGQGWEGAAKLRRGKKLKTFKEAAKDYLEERDNYKASTLASYKTILEKYLYPEFSNRTLNDLTDSDLRKFQTRISKQVSASRVNTVMQLLRSILRQECNAGTITRNPALAVNRLKRQRTKVDPLSEAELEAVLANIDKHYRPLFITLAFTGARPNEMLALRWGDIDWGKPPSLEITKGRVRGHEGLPKTESSQRTIPLVPRVIETLESLKDGQNVVSVDGYVFTKPNGQPIDKHLDRIWSRALKQAGIKHRPSYQLRHTFATQCIIKGLPLPYIAKVLGHSTIDTLIRHYTGWIDAATKDNDDKLRSVFASVSKSSEAG